jgi:hypothetical protein
MVGGCSDALGTDTPVEVAVKLAESLMREPITKSDRGRQGILHPPSSLISARPSNMIYSSSSPDTPRPAVRVPQRGANSGHLGSTVIIAFDPGQHLRSGQIDADPQVVAHPGGSIDGDPGQIRAGVDMS